MAQAPKNLPFPTSDTLMPAAPFAQAIHPLLRAKPQPESPKTNAVLFYEQRCEDCMDVLFDTDSPLQKKLDAAFELGSLLGKVEDKEKIETATFIMKETMVDASEDPSLRMACAVSLGSSGYKGFVDEMLSLLKEDADKVPFSSKILVLKALAINRSEQAIEQLGLVARNGDSYALSIAAARELLSIPTFQAQKIVGGLVRNPPRAFSENPEFFVEFRRLAECSLPLN